MDGTVFVTVNGITQSTNFFASSSTWTNQIFYFKAGSYCQDNVGTSSEGAWVSFYSLTLAHGTNAAVAPTISMQPQSVTVASNSSASFSVTASGTEPLAYQWRFKATNNLANATNASLTILNSQATNAGAYIVVVTNSAGSITSSVATLTVNSGVLQTWTQKSLAGDAVTAGESSAAVAMDANYMFVGDNEHEKLRLFLRYPTNACPEPVYTFDVRPSLNLSSTDPEDDIEAAVKTTVGGTNRIYWLGSHSNSKNSGALRPNRYRLFATQVSGSGNGSPPYTLSYLGRYDKLRDDLIAWDKNNLHGKGANYYGLEASAAAGVTSEAVNGFNMEGLCLAPDGTTAYLAFRTPLVNGSGATTASGQRTNALIIPLLNLTDLVTNSLVPGPGKAMFGVPFTLNLGIRGIRSIDSSYPGNYLITAGPPGDVSAPPAAPENFRLYTWTGNPADAPDERLINITGDYGPEGAMLPAEPISSSTMIQFVSDDSTACWRSFTTLAGEVLPKITSQPASLTVPQGSNATFSVVVAGTAPLSYQWRFNATNNLAGSTNADLTITNAQSTNAGNFRVVITSASGALTSAVATLTVTLPSAPPARLGIVTQPAGALTVGLASTLTTPPVIEVQDAAGLAVNSATTLITVSLISGNGTLSGTTNVAANGVNGRAMFSNLVLYASTPGSLTLMFAASGLPSTNAQPLIVTMAPAMQVLFSTQPGGAVNGQPFTTQPVLITADRFGNPSTVGLPGSLVVTLTNSSGTLSGVRTNDLGTNFLNGMWTSTNLAFSGTTGVPSTLFAVADAASFGKAQLKFRWRFNGNLGEFYSGSNAVLMGGPALYANTNTRVSLDCASTYVDLGQKLISGLSNVTVQVFATRASSSTSPSNLTMVEFGGKNPGGSGVNYLWLSHKIGSSGAFAGAQATTNWPGTTNFWSRQTSTLGLLQYGHLAVAFDPAASDMKSWLSNTVAIPVSPLSNGGWNLSALNDTNCFVGRKIFDHALASTFSQIDVDEVRIWEGLLDEAAIASYVAAGADQTLLRNVQSATFQISTNPPASPPSFDSVLLSGSNLIMSGSGGTAGGNYYVLASTNLTLPLAGWSRMATNAFDLGGNFNLTNGMNSASADQFFLLQLP